MGIHIRHSLSHTSTNPIWVKLRLHLWNELYIQVGFFFKMCTVYKGKKNAKLDGSDLQQIIEMGLV